jgi:large subunit ribosomal protein L4
MLAANADANTTFYSDGPQQLLDYPVEENKKYYVYLVATLGNEYSQVYTYEFETEEFTFSQLATVVGVTPDGYKMFVKVPQSVKTSQHGAPGSKAIRYAQGDLMIYNFYKATNDDTYSMLYNGGKYLTEDSMVEFSDALNYGEAGADIAFDDAQLTLDKGAQAVKDAVTAIRNAMRAGTACTKGKGEVAGSNKKPWKQKGTGNARAGFRQSPVWRGGGVAHGPKPRDFSQKVNRKVMQLAFARAFSEKIAAGEVIVVSEFKFDEPKTKLMAALLKKAGVERSALIVTEQFDENVFRVTANLARAAWVTANEADVYSVLKFKTIVCDKAGFEALAKRMSVVKEAK